MPQVDNEIFLHIRRINEPPWGQGTELSVGNQVNKYFSGFDAALRRFIVSPAKDKFWYVKDVAEDVLRVIEGGERNEELAEFYDYNPASTLKETYQALWETLNYIRELVFEEVRAASFPDLPSRNRCIWLIRDRPNDIRYWWPAIGSTRARIYRLQVSGRLHTGSERFVRSQTFLTDRMETECRELLVRTEHGRAQR